MTTRTAHKCHSTLQDSESRLDGSTSGVKLNGSLNKGVTSWEDP